MTVQDAEETTSLLRPLLGERYEIGRLIGSGGAADVFAGRDLLLNREVAIKVIRPLALSDLPQATVDTEIRLLAGLQHPGLVALFDAGADASTGEVGQYIVMELVQGPNLADLLRQRTLTVVEAESLCEQLADALAYVHARGIVHGDVKPANILVGLQCGELGLCAKLSDFGVARRVDGVVNLYSGLIVGTANYVSPEQATGTGREGTPTDVYSLGLTMIEALSGHPAFPGQGLRAARARLERSPVIPDHIDPALRKLLERMTARNPIDRPCAAGVRDELHALQRIRAATMSSMCPPVFSTAHTAFLEPNRDRRGAHRSHHRRRAPLMRAAFVLTVVAAGLMLGRSILPAPSSVAGVGRPGSPSSPPALAQPSGQVAHAAPMPTSSGIVPTLASKPKSTKHGRGKGD